MTAVASPPNFQSLPRLGWNSSGDDTQAGANTMSAEDVSRMFMPRKGPKRTNSSSSISSNGTITNEAKFIPEDQQDLALEGAQETKRPVKAKSDYTKNDVVEYSSLSAVAAAARAAAAAPQPNRQQAVPAPVVGSVPASLATTNGQNLANGPPQKSVPTPQHVNGVRMVPAIQQNGSEPPTRLVLLPLNSTFERKQINVPLFPEILRVGRQTNAKTLPTSANGYFDSKVLSRQHAEVWADRSGKIWIRDVKSSNGTFVNGVRLSPESRDSEPHELRENDVLELGIDIVSEDQKSIVHHKVSAKVEHAGPHNNTASVLDLNFADIDPGSGGGLMYPAQGQARGRVNSQGSITSNGRSGVINLVNGNANGVGVQRHMNAWLSPVTVEQVVRRLTSELKSAQQQSHDLNRTNDFFSALLTTKPGEDLPKAPVALMANQPQTNGLKPHPRSAPMSHFSEPPAPPPQHPLPEKPDGSRSLPSHKDLLSHTKRTDSFTAQTTSHESPTQADHPNQILSLVEALTSAKKEIDSQGIRVRQLEDLLRQERQAREDAEDRARHLLKKSGSSGSTSTQIGDSGPLESNPSTGLGKQGPAPPELGSGRDVSLQSSPAAALSSEADQIHQDTAKIDESTTRLQERLSLMVREMTEMRKQMESFRRRAEDAEGERTGLEELVKRIQQGQPIKEHLLKPKESAQSTEMSTQTDSAGAPSPPDRTEADEKLLYLEKVLSGANGSAAHSHEQLKHIHSAVSTALAHHQHDNRLMQSAPYASILGVVLIGVGLMSYLNGWQKIDS